MPVAVYRADSVQVEADLPDRLARTAITASVRTAAAMPAASWPIPLRRSDVIKSNSPPTMAVARPADTRRPSRRTITCLSLLQPLRSIDQKDNSAAMKNAAATIGARASTVPGRRLRKRA
jgi:hypothetical protein